MTEVKRCVAVLTVALMITPVGGFASNHRSAPISSLDHTAGITDWYAFVSPDNPNTVTFIMDVDPLLEPSNGPNYFPFDPNVTYEMKIDNSYDGVEDITFQFQFTTVINASTIPVGFIGASTGVVAPLNAPSSLTTMGATSNVVVPPAVTALTGTGSGGINLSQTYTVSMITGSGSSPTITNLGQGQTLYAVPTNVGPRTMPCYAPPPAGTVAPCTGPLAPQGIYTLGTGPGAIKVFAGTVDDPFFVDLGAAFDSLNFRSGSSLNGIGGVLSTLQDATDNVNYAADSLSGFNVNTIALQVPISLLVTSGANPVIGTWAATYRPAQTIRTAPSTTTTGGPLQQVQRLGNPLITELIIGTGSKDTYSMSQPSGDSQFSNFFLDPLLAHVFNAMSSLGPGGVVTVPAGPAITVPDPPRKDLLPLVTYSGPAVPANIKAGPVADMLRLNTSIIPQNTAGFTANSGCTTTPRRMGVLAGDLCGFPNGRRLIDDVIDIAARAVAGALCNTPVNFFPANTTVTNSSCTAAGSTFVGTQAPLIGDGVNANDVPLQTTFPYVAFAQSGYTRVHHNAGDKACGPSGTTACATQ